MVVYLGPKLCVLRHGQNALRRVLEVRLFQPDGSGRCGGHGLLQKDVPAAAEGLRGHSLVQISAVDEEARHHDVNCAE